MSTSRQSLAVNVSLSLAVTALFLGGGEMLARRLERKVPDPLGEKLALWDRVWHGNFYLMNSTTAGWPPWRPINRDGLQDRTHAVEKPEGVWRVVVLGDSVTAGPPFQPDEGFPAILQGLLDQRGPWVEVFSVALYGWSTLQERLAFERIARRYRPDQVVVGLCLNDVQDLQNNLTRPPALLAALYEHSALVRWAVNARAREVRSIEELFTDTPKIDAAWARLFAEMRLLRDEVQATGATFSVLVFPVEFQFGPGAPPPRAQERMAAFCAAEKIRCLDLRPAFAALGGAAFEDLLHFTHAGRALVAERILAEGLIPSEVASARALWPAIGAAAPDSEPPSAPALGPHVEPALVKALDNAAPRVRTEAAWALGRMGPAAAASVPALARALGDGHESVRAQAALALGRIGPEARGALPALFAALGDARQSVRWRASEAIWKVGGDTEDEVPALTAALRSEDPYVRAGAVWTLRDLGPPAHAALPALAQATRDPDVGVRAVAVQAVARLGRGERAGIETLVDAMRGQGDADYRWKAARALGRMGPQAAEATPALAAALSDDNGHVRIEAAIALGKIGPQAEAAIPALARALQDDDASIRGQAAVALGRIGSPAAAAALDSLRNQR